MLMNDYEFVYYGGKVVVGLVGIFMENVYVEN